MRLAILLPFLLLAGCATKVQLQYQSTMPPLAVGPAAIGGVTVTDARNEPDPTYVGAIRTGFGSPLKTMLTARPVREDVAAAFDSALRTRGLFAPGAVGALRVRLDLLAANQVVRREAEITFTLVLTGAGGRALYTATEAVDNKQIELASSGVLASIDDLKAYMDLALSQAIDRALDKPAFRAALAGG